VSGIEYLKQFVACEWHRCLKGDDMDVVELRSGEALVDDVNRSLHKRVVEGLPCQS